MNVKALSLAVWAALSLPAQSFEITTPDALVHTASLEVSDPDEHVPTLGTVEIFIDLAASHDDLFALKVRRSDLTLPDGRPFTAFGVHKASGIIVLAGGKVARVSISSVQAQRGHRETLVLFHGDKGQILAPNKNDLAVFDKDFKPLAFDYKPLAPPGASQIPVNILLDASGSMRGHMGTVVAATRDFMRALPAFTNCSVTLFNGKLTLLTKSIRSCPDSTGALYAPIKPHGMTALFQALEKGFDPGPLPHSYGAPIITVVVTDGINTAPYTGGLETLKDKKKGTRAKLFVFWAGSYSQGYLEDLPDLEFVSTSNLRSELEKFFRSLGISISGLQTLLVRV